MAEAILSHVVVFSQVFGARVTLLHVAEPANSHGEETSTDLPHSRLPTPAESLASENASRLASMQAAERNIEEHADAFNAQYQQQRQHAITGELLDIVGGFEALTHK